MGKYLFPQAPLEDSSAESGEELFVSNFNERQSKNFGGKEKVSSNLLFAMEILDNRKTCYNCFFYRNNACSLHSSRCATDNLHHKEVPSRWLSIEDGERVEEQMTEQEDGRKLRKQAHQ